VVVKELDDPGAFLEAVAPLLLEDEARNNLMLGIAGTLRDHPSHYDEYRSGSSRAGVAPSAARSERHRTTSSSGGLQASAPCELSAKASTPRVSSSPGSRELHRKSSASPPFGKNGRKSLDAGGWLSGSTA